ncbi:MAG: hypothetical protein K2O36_03740 [Ruminococcus sp.]|nr:hypothetical protein [Ruminococcus sp.]
MTIYEYYELNKNLNKNIAIVSSKKGIWCGTTSTIPEKFDDCEIISCERQEDKIILITND